MRIRDKIARIVRLAEPLFNGKLKDSFDFTKRISDFVGMIVRIGIVNAVIIVVFDSSPSKGQEFTYWTSLAFFSFIYVLMVFAIFRVLSDLIDLIIAAWLDDDFKVDLKGMYSSAREGKVTVLIANALALVTMTLMLSGISYGISQYISKN